MKLTPKNQLKSDFSVFSMTDIVFLLLIFFMLTSQFVTPSGLDISVPTSSAATKVVQRVTIAITKDLRHYINGKETSLQQLKSNLEAALSQTSQGSVLLSVDKSVPVQNLIDVVSIVNELKAPLTVITRPAVR